MDKRLIITNLNIHIASTFDLCPHIYVDINHKFIQLCSRSMSLNHLVKQHCKLTKINENLDDTFLMITHTKFMASKHVQ
jgi:hypothetical protein